MKALLGYKATEVSRFFCGSDRLGVVPIGTLRLYEIFTNGSRPASELEQLWSRVGICELLPGLTEYEARQIIQQALGRIPETTTKQILRQTGNSVRRLAKLLDQLREPKRINVDREVEELISVVGDTVFPLRL